MIELAEIPAKLRDERIERRVPSGPHFNDLTGHSFSGVKVIGLAGFIGKGTVWLCRCRCGKQFIVSGASLKHGDRATCGCRRKPKQRRPKSVITHGKRLITANGETLSLTEWAKRIGISREAMRTRMNRCLENNLDVALAVTADKSRPWNVVKMR